MYATQAGMVARFGQKEVVALTDRDFTGVIDEAVLTTALEMSGYEIDGYLGGRYNVPMDNPPPILIGFACDIARYRLCGTGGVQATDEIRDRYKDAIRFLEHVAAGRVTLGGLPEGSSATTNNQVRFVSGAKSFGRDTTNGGAY